MTVSRDACAMAFHPSEMPSRPRRWSKAYDVSGHFRVAHRDPGEVTIDRSDTRDRIAIECGDLQPGRRVQADVFWLGIAASGDVARAGQILANNLPKPKNFTLVIAADIASTVMSLDELLRLREPPAEAWD